MQTVWFIMVALMLTGYVVLDGFDLGAGVLHLIAARNEPDRRAILNAIGPVWDGNEVWLIAAGGTLFYAFPPLYASSFSGFYLPLNIVLWLLVFRAIGIDFRRHLNDRLWCDFFDGMFAIASVLLVVLFGAALGNVVRGVPLGHDHKFFLPLWTDFSPRGQPGALDWYTVLCAIATVLIVSMHGALYLILKTSDALNRRLRTIVYALFPAVVLLTGATLFATVRVRPAAIDNFRLNPWGWLVPAAVTAALFAIIYFTRAGRERDAFLASCAYIVAMLAGAAFALYPDLLPSSGDPLNALNIHNAAAGPRSLRLGLYWWAPGMVVAIGYFVLVYSMFRGKVGRYSSYF